MGLQKDFAGNETRQLHEFADFAGRRVLEVGCGDGRLTWRYAGSARAVCGIDLDADELRVARIERPSDLESTVTLARSDALHLPFRSRSFDLAIFAWSF